VYRRKAFDVMKKEVNSKKKSYRCVVWVAKALKGPQDLAFIKQIKDLEIAQKTPIRVLHRSAILRSSRRLVSNLCVSQAVAADAQALHPRRRLRVHQLALLHSGPHDILRHVRQRVRARRPGKARVWSRLTSAQVFRFFAKPLFIMCQGRTLPNLGGLVRHNIV
jgi:hypothetical protein